MLRRLLFNISVCVLMWSTAHAQSTHLMSDPDESFKQAKILYQQGQYSQAYPVFKQLAQLNQPINTEFPVRLGGEARYYYIACGLQLNRSDAPDLAVTFIQQKSDIARTQMLAFLLGEYYYRNKDYTNALSFFEQTNIANLNNRQIAAMKFKQAYAYFVAQDFEKAKPLFNIIRQLPNDPNYLDANYYYGFLQFNDRKYEEAIQSFVIAEKEPAYQQVVPFYLTELYYFNGEKDKALSTGEKAIQTGTQYYDLQLRQLLGHIWFEKKKFDKALPYLEKYVQGKEKVSRSELYELSYCYYQMRFWNKAIEGFKQIGGAADSLAQNSMYLLADAYLKVDDYQNARNAFQFCAANNSNLSQKEVSVFHYAKLSYSLGNLGQAAASLQSFIKAYPNSIYQREAQEILLSTMANTSSYKDGLVMYEQMSNKNDQIAKIYPELLYGRTVELINDQQIASAENLLDRIMEVPYNDTYIPLVHFWKGELSYRSGKTDEAIDYLQSYLKNPLRNGEVNSTNARYNLAYCLLKKEQYRQARDQFEMVIKSISNTSGEVKNDAYIRAADCYFMSKDYRKALAIYDQAIQYGWSSADYALFQKSIIAGAQNKQKEKMELLATLEQQYPKSFLIPNAKMELADTYIAEGDFEKSLKPLYYVINNDQAISIRPQAYLKLGIALFNLDKNDASLDQFKFLVNQYPNSPETETAVEYIRNIFVEKQTPDAYIAFMESNGKAVSVNEADSLVFRSAMRSYESKDFSSAEAGFLTYLQNYPNGRYKLEANYFLAEMNVIQKKATTALNYYNAVLSLSPNKYAERSALQVGRINYFDIKNYPDASSAFQLLKNIALQQENRLEAMRGLLRCQFKTQNWKDAAPNAAELLEQKGIALDDQLMAGFVLARNEQLNDQPDKAMELYKALLVKGKSAITAEAQYRIAELYLQKGQFDLAEKTAFEVIKKYGSYDYWVTSSYILIGEVYFKQNDLFNAEATLKSVVDNATIDELKKDANEKLSRVLAQKSKNNKVE